MLTQLPRLSRTLTTGLRCAVSEAYPQVEKGHKMFDTPGLTLRGLPLSLHMWDTDSGGQLYVSDP